MWHFSWGSLNTMTIYNQDGGDIKKNYINWRNFKIIQISQGRQIECTTMDYKRQLDMYTRVCTCQPVPLCLEFHYSNS